ncbi:carbohydrate-binding protein [Streptosporangiaceae bacterium NEAU-GS5]|nr:carbohydrate-binding protein [Streptosporangiaceae bacterium NEAU-GS5]
MLERVLKTVLAAFVVIAPAVALAAPAHAATFNVRDYGATGNGSSNDSSAINSAITAAFNAGGGTVQFPSGTYKVSNTIHLRSNVLIQVDSGATIMGSSSDTYDAPESNPNDDFQDYGHSHFHNAMFYGDRLTGIGFVGTGTIDGGGNLITGNPDSGQADKILSLTRCDGLTLNGVRFRRGGHFAILTNNCNNITSDHLRIDTASDRDGWNVISASNVTVTNADIAANDDALVFKSDYALGAKLPNGHVTVTDSHLSAGCCNALMFGSETCGDFTDYNFQRITITGANKSGLGMVSMDGAVITDVHYRDITMSNVRSAIMQKIGTRRRCGNSPGVGHIENITYDNVTSTGQSSSNFSATLWGEAGTSNRIRNVTFNNVNVSVPGGSGAISTGVPSNNATDYNPNSIGTRPAYGWYIHNAHDIHFINSGVQFVSNDNRPAVIANTGSSVTFDRFTAERGSGSAYDMGFQTVTGYCVSANSQNTTGGALRTNATGSTQSCTTADDYSLAVTPSSRTVPSGGGTATYTVNTSVVSGAPGNITLGATGLPPGASASFSPNPVAAGSSSTMTVTTTGATPDGTSTITVTGTGTAGTRTASTGLTVGTPTSSNVYAEAESGTVTAPMQIQSDANAWGGQFVTVAAGNNSTGSAPSSGLATIPFSVPTAGTYRFWGRVMAPADTDDSFWVKIDNGGYVNWNDITAGAAWHWAPVTNDSASDAPITASLAAGAHTMTVAYREDGAKLDRILATTDASFTPPNDPPPAGVRYEAENATISQGIFENTHTGFSGTGYVNADNVAGSYVEFTVNADTAGPATLKLRYANGTTTNRPMAIAVNGATVATRDYNATANWDTWATDTLTVNLNAGSNTIRLTGTTANGGPNVDYIEF